MKVDCGLFVCLPLGHFVLFIHYYPAKQRILKTKPEQNRTKQNKELLDIYIRLFSAKGQWLLSSETETVSN